MAFKYQLCDLKRGTIRNIAGVCMDSQGFIDVANEIQRRLLRRGNWDDVAHLVRLCVSDGCVTWPHYVGTILGARFCDGQLAEMRNNWYSITSQTVSMRDWQGTSGPFSHAAGGWNDIVFEDAGRGPTYNRISGTTGRLIRYYVKYYKDIGKTITLYGKQYGGQPLQHLDVNGDWVDGLVLTAAAPFVSTTIYVTEITSVVRDATQGMAYLYEYDPVADKLRDLAVYEPNETNPRYRKSAIRNFCQAPGCQKVTTVSGTDYTTRQSSIEAMVKLNVYDLVNDNDFLLIDNFEAFKFGFQAVKLEEQNDDTMAEVKWLKAVRELNFDLRDKNPDNTTPVYVNTTMGRGVYSVI
jgi:hypothetical protein